jgi:hypothetical protein
MIHLALSTFTWVIIIVLAVVLFIILKKRSQARARNAAPPPDLANLTIKDARVGDVVSISGFGDEYDDVDFVIERRNRYESGGIEWYELKGAYRGRQVWIEWEDDDHLEITASSPERELRLSQVNLTEEDLARMDQEESRDNFLEWEGRRFYYRDSCEAFFYRDGTGAGEGFYLWDFLDEAGEEFVSVEKWEGEPFAVFSGRTIQPYNVKVYKR